MAACALSAIGVATPAMAQDGAATGEGQSAGQGAWSGDIVVTARRREESLSKVPVAVTALSGESMVRQGVRSELDLQIAVPGFLARQVGTSNVLSYQIRGQSIDGYSSSPPAVLPYVNEFQISPPGKSAFFDIESVEVLKGPQGTLFGRNTTGGAVLYRTKKPGNEFEGFVSGRYGNFDEVQVQAGVTLPIISERLSVRLAGNYSDGGGFVKNLGYYRNTGFADYGGGFIAPSQVTFVPLNKTLGDVRNKSIRATIWMSPFDGVENTTVVQYGADDGTQTPGMIYSVYPVFGAQTIFDLVNVTDGPFAGGPGALTRYTNWQRGTNRKTYSELDNKYRARTLMLTNTTEVELGTGLALKNIVGWYKSSKNAVIDLDGSGFHLYGNTDFFAPQFSPEFDPKRGGQYLNDWNFSNELQLQGKALDGKLDFVLGLYYANARLRTDASLQFYGFTIAPYVFKTRDKSSAVFAQATYAVTDKLNLTGGFRYGQDKIRGRQLPGGFYTTGSPFEVANPGLQQEQKLSFKNPSWTASVDYQVTPDLMIYATQRGSWRAGGLNFPVPPYPFDGTGLVTDENPLGLVGNIFKPEKSRDIELGAKYSGSVGDVRINATFAFFSQWVKGIQRSAFQVVGGAPSLVTVNVPKAKVTGQEFSLNVRPSGWLSFGGQLTHTKARYTDADTFTVGFPRTFGPYGDQPKWTGSAFVELTHAMADDSSVSLRGDVYGQTSMQFTNYTPPQHADTKIDGYALINARLSWNKIMGTGLTAAVYGRNLGNKQWYGGGIPTETAFGVNVAAPGAPRQYGIELRFDF
jgi:iron complex outermembrane receptor protein